MKVWKKPELVELDVGETLGGALGGFPETYSVTLGTTFVTGAS